MASLAPLTGTLGKRLAAHLLRRTTFTPTMDNIDSFKDMTVADAVEELLTLKPPSLDKPLDPLTGEPWIDSNTPPQSDDFLLRGYLRAWWLDEAMKDLSVGHKMSFFLHTAFVAHIEELNNVFSYDHLQVLSTYALGNYRDFSERMTIDNLMLRYLDNTENHKDNPNENYAREFLELFTIGKGPQIAPGNYTNYTEDDIREAARLLTGFRVDWDRDPANKDEFGINQGRVSVWAHDKGNKTFSSAFQGMTIVGRETETGMMEELSDFVDMVFDQDATAVYICTKLYRYFVNTEVTPEIEQDIIAPLAATFRSNNYELEPVLRQLLNSQHFYDRDDSNSGDNVVGALIKGPLELATHSLQALNFPIPPNSGSQDDLLLHYENFYRQGFLNDFLEDSGFGLFEPPSVAGYPAYHQFPTYDENWFNATSIITRFKIGKVLIEGKRASSNFSTLGGPKLDVVAYAEQNISNPASPDVLVTELLELLLPEFPDNNRYKYFLNTVFLQGQTKQDWTDEWVAYANGEKDDFEVRIGLESLVNGILYAQEYQLF